MNEDFLSDKLNSESDKYVTKYEFENLKKKVDEEKQEIGELNKNTLIQKLIQKKTLKKIHI